MPIPLMLNSCLYSFIWDKNSYYSKTFLHRNQAQARLWFVRLLFKNNKRNDKCFNNHSYSLLGGAPTSICPFSVCSAICLSICLPRTISQEPYINHNLWGTCVKWWYLQGYFSFFEVLIFWAVRWVKGH